MTPRKSANAAPSGPAGGAPDSSGSTQIDYLPRGWKWTAIGLAIVFNVGCACWIFFRIHHLCSGHDSCWNTLFFDPLPSESAAEVSVTPMYSGTRFPLWVTSLREEAGTGVFLWKGMLLAIAVTVLTGIEFLIFRVRGDARHRSEQAADAGHDEKPEQGETQEQDEQGEAKRESKIAGFFHWLGKCFEAKGGLFLFCLSFLPAALFFAAMILDGEQDAAVFAMALAAIFVAAEHYSSLERQKGIASEQRKDLRSQLTYLNDLNAQLRTNVRSIVSALGKSPAQEEMYRLYSLLPEEKKKDDGKRKPPEEPAAEPDGAEEGTPAGAPAAAVPDQTGTSQNRQAKEEEEPELTQSDRRIYAIFRECFVDPVWWNEGRDKRQWDTFLEITPASGHMTLAHALMKGNRRRVTIVVPYGFRRKSGDDISFQNFIGLMWHCVLFEKTAERMIAKDALNKATSSHIGAPNPSAGGAQQDDANDAIELRISMADTALWLHVVDRDVHQIVDQPDEEIMVRNLSLNINERAMPLAQWAKREIEQLASYGPGAEEFLCVALCNAFPDLFNDNRLDEGMAGAILRSSSLKMESWLSQEPNGRESRERGCVRLLMDFAEMLYARQNGKKPDATTRLSTRIFSGELE
ncbi:hypothetical protein [Paraburkholderia oxyphila]|uniref:hypothetical protein n=1 Tax=Paraburkholderia oxyphila TaxID=614212 RepID=UPI0004865484|nr:hypothetical protein [Paraburkholderia oxyphila]